LSHHREQTCDMSLREAVVLRRLADAQHPLPSPSTSPGHPRDLHREPGASMWVPLACLAWWRLGAFALPPLLVTNAFGVVLLTPFVVVWCLGYLDVKRIEPERRTETEGRRTQPGAGQAAGSYRDLGEAHGHDPTPEELIRGSRGQADAEAG